MNSDAFAAWSSLFDEGVKNVWVAECRELKCAAMALHALKRELKKVENTFEAKLNSYKERLLNQNCGKVENVKRQIFPIVKPAANTSLAIPQPVLDSSISKDTSEVSELDQAITDVDIELSDNDVTKIGTPSESPKITKNRNILKRRKPTPQQSVLNFTARNKSTSSIDSNASLNLLHFNKTPQKATENLLDFLDSSIIENTPVLNKTRKRKKKEVSKGGLGKNATLTQMFGNETTFVPPSVEAAETSEAGAAADDGSMFIDEILDYINQDNEQEAAERALDANLAAGNTKQQCFPVQKRTSANYVYKPETVRGKARMNLPGWSCKQCRDFYEALGLSPDELKIKMDECSKHKSKFPPADDTPAGFWDLTLPPTPATFYE